MTYTGICIGGPIDGKRLDAEQDVIRFQMKPKSLARPFEGLPDRLGTVEATNYLWIEMHEGYGVWLCVDLQDPEMDDRLVVLKHLAGSYENSIARKRERNLVHV